MNEVDIKLPFDDSDQFRQLICKDKSILIVELNSKFFKINKSEFILDIARDVTERRLSEEKLLASEDKFHKAFHSSPVALGITSLANGSFIELNESLSHLLEYSFDEVMGHTTIELNIWSRQADRFSYIDALKKDGFIHNKELIIRCKSGKYKTVLMSSEIINIEGNPCMLSTLFDITKIKQIERAKIETQRLSAIGEMSASIAHDFNNSLQAILGNLELATYKSDFPEAKMKLINTAKTLVVDAASRVQKLQKFGGKTESNSEYLQIDLNNILIDVVNQTKPLWKGEAEKKGITIDLVSKFDDGIEIHGNANELRTAIYNILKNSIEALYKSGQIIIETRKKSEGIFVTITDTGMGMSEATRIKIFEPFFSTKGLELGRGLGMSGVYAVIAEHKGKVYVKESELGVGTTIEILFPVSPKN
jgi:PAS domain S-box-containing protein